MLQNLTVTEETGTPVSVEDSKFTMPHYDMTVLAVFSTIFAQLTIIVLPGETVYQGTAFWLFVSSGSGTVN